MDGGEGHPAQGEPAVASWARGLVGDNGEVGKNPVMAEGGREKNP